MRDVWKHKIQYFNVKVIDYHGAGMGLGGSIGVTYIIYKRDGEEWYSLMNHSEFYNEFEKVEPLYDEKLLLLLNKFV